MNKKQKEDNIMNLRTLATISTILALGFFASKSFTQEAPISATTTPYYQIDPAMVLASIQGQTEGKITSVDEIKMYLGKDLGALQFCTPDSTTDEFIFGIIKFSMENTTVNWAELTLQNDDTAPFICDAIAQEGEPTLLEFYLSDIAGIACLARGESVACKPFI